MSREMVCTACGSVSEGKTVTRGSIFIEIILWLCFLIPGLIYSIWRMSSRYKVCAQCNSKDIVPIDSPVGRRLIKEFHPHEDFTSAAEDLGRYFGKMFSKK